MRPSRARAFQLLPATFLVLAFAWPAAIVATPYGAAYRPFNPTAIRAAGVMYMAGSFICHQRPERSFHLRGAQLPVCARCTGVYVGAAVGALLAALFRGRVSRRDDSAIATRRRWRAILIAAALPTAIALAIEWTNLAPLSRTVRAVAAVPFGAAVAWLVADVLRGDMR